MVLGLLLTFIGGCITVISKIINYKLCKGLGLYNGTLINYIGATFISVPLIFFSQSKEIINLNTLSKIPAWTFLGGVFGLLALLISIIMIPKVPIFYSTILVLVGQLGAGFIIDEIIKGEFSWIKLLGIILVILGIGLDKLIINRIEIQKGTEN